MADRIDHTSARIPAPSKPLLRSMASAGYRVGGEMTLRRVIPFASLNSDVQDNWVSVATAMYAELALAGGAKVSKVTDA